LGEDAVERLRIGLLFGNRTPHDAFAVTLAVDRERARTGDADARGQPLPFGFRRRQNILGLARGLEEAIDRRSIARCPGPLEGVTDDGHRTLGAEALHDAVHLDRALLSLAFEIGAEIPERQRGVALALQRFLRQERRGRTGDRGPRRYV